MTNPSTVPPGGRELGLGSDGRITTVDWKWPEGPITYTIVVDHFTNEALVRQIYDELKRPRRSFPFGEVPVGFPFSSLSMYLHNTVLKRAGLPLQLPNRPDPLDAWDREYAGGALELLQKALPRLREVQHDRGWEQTLRELVGEIQDALKEPPPADPSS